MRIIALIAVYNEELYVAACLEHLFRHGISAYLIDNESTDRTVPIAEQYLGQGLVGIETMSRAHGHVLREKLERKEKLAASLDADWFIHMDVDEFRLPPRLDQTLAEALMEVDAQGYNAVNFLEYAFIPTQESPDHAHVNFQETMRWYYPFIPKFPHRLSAWKRQPQRINLAQSASHFVDFPGIKVCPQQFRMRHYHFLSVEHAISRHVGRPYTREEIDKGWHYWRVRIQPQMVKLPSQSDLHQYTSDDALDPSRSRRIHYLGELVNAQTADGPWLTSPFSAAGKAPVPFVIGSADADTELLTAMLDNHPELAMVSEIPLIPALVSDCHASKNPAETFIETITNHDGWSHFQIDSDELRKAITGMERFDVAGALRVVNSQRAKKLGKPRWGEHATVDSINVELIKGLLPEVRFIRIIRDDTDAVLSHDQSSIASDSRDDATRQSVVRVQAAPPAHTWMDCLEIRHEDLILAPEPTLKRVCEFIELPWNPAMLKPLSKGRASSPGFGLNMDSLTALARRFGFNWRV